MKAFILIVYICNSPAWIYAETHGLDGTKAYESTPYYGDEPLTVDALQTVTSIPRDQRTTLKIELTHFIGGGQCL